MHYFIEMISIETLLIEVWNFKVNMFDNYIFLRFLNDS